MVQEALTVQGWFELRVATGVAGGMYSTGPEMVSAKIQTTTGAVNKSHRQGRYFATMSMQEVWQSSAVRSDHDHCG